ncbi:MAG TPA: SDR family NAD(P)-dependent oxidoreductase [Ruminiclostridium sp.]|nr:SDR family NAD(P)-dependent oxidoreductase [Ruminiclostridium sp.]
MDGIFSNSPNVEAFWENLYSVKDLMEEIPLDHFDYRPWFSTDRDAKDKMYSKWGSFVPSVDKFDADFFNISPREAEAMDPQLRLLLQVLYHTIEDAGVIRSIRGSRTGMFVGSCFHDYSSEIARIGKPVEPYDGSGNAQTMYSNRPSFFFDLKGPSISVDTACSSSLVAIHLACQALRNGECDMALAAGVNLLLTSSHYRYFCSIGALSSTGRCHAFEKSADGYTPGEGIAAILLKPLDKAIADGNRIHGIVKGSAVNHGGYTPSVTAPSMKMEAQVVMDAWEAANIDPDTLGYIEAHGTGTKLGDPIEINALKEAFKKYTDKKGFCAIGSAKAHIGHTEGAAGVTGVIKALMSIKNRKIPAMPLFKELNPFIDIKDSPLFINTKSIPWETPDSIPRRAGVSSFGFGGAYAHLVLEEYAAPSEEEQGLQGGEPCLMVISAKTKASLINYIESLRGYLLSKADEGIRLDTIASTLAFGREELDKRIAIVASSYHEFIEKLNAFCSSPDTEIDGIFTGDNEKKGTKSSTALMEEVYLTHNLKEIAGLWVQGASIQWERVLNKRQIITLPGYCFEEKRYWMMDHYTEEKTVKLNELIDSNESTLIQQKFKKVFTREDKFLNDHRINGKNVLPGVVSLEMVRTAAQMANDNGTVREIHNFQWNKPIVLNSDKIEVFAEFGIEESRVYTDVYSVNNGESEYHAQGEIIYEEVVRDYTTARVDINSLKSELTENVSGSDCYKRLKALGLDIGPSLQSIKMLHIGNGSILAELETDYGSSDDFYAHPSLLDGSIQATIGFSYKEDGILQVPYMIKKVCYFLPISKACYAYLKINENNSSTLQEKEVDIDILSTEGEIAIQIKGLTIKPIVYAHNQPKADIVTCRYQWNEQPLYGQQEKALTQRLFLVAENNNVPLYKSVKDCLKKYQWRVEYLMQDSHLVENFEKLCRDGNAPDGIIYLQAGLTDKSFGLEDAKEIRTGFIKLFEFVKHLITTKNNIKFYHISSSPLYSGVEPFLNTAGSESSLFRYKYMELLSEEQIEDCIKEITVSEYNLPIRFKDGKRYVKNVMPYSLPKSVTPVLKDDKVYLITGGVGEIGQRLAEYIVQRYNCRLVLIGRSPLSERKKELLERLNNLNGNAKAVYKSCDITDENALKSLLQSVRTEFGGIDGILHLAGTIKDAMIINKSTESINSVLNPKVIGTVLLDLLTREDKLDFFICFSSISGIKGNVGQSDYAFANGFMDTYSECRNRWSKEGKCSGKTYSIDWPYWEEGGMDLAADAIDYLQKKYGSKPLSTKDGLNLLDGLAEAETPLAVLYGDPQKVNSQFIVPKDAEVDAKNISLADDSAVRGKLEEQLTAMFALIQRVDAVSIKPTSELSSYGLDSISISEYTRLISKTFGIELMPAVFFEISNIRNLAEYLIENFHGAFANYYHGSSNNTEVQQVSAPTSSAEPRPIVPKLRKNKFRIHSQQSDVDKEPIAVVGIAGILPLSNNLDEFWKALEEGKSLISVVPASRWDWNEYYGNPRTEVNKTNIKWAGFINGVDEFDAQFFGISPREAEMMDPQQRIFMRVVWEVIENAGYKVSDLSGTKTGIYVGVGNFDYSDLIKENGIPIDSYASTGIAHSVLANRISFLLNLRGPSQPVDTACSSALVAIHNAIEAITLGYCDMAIAGGVNLILNPNMTISFSKAGMLSEDGRCKTFDKSANGYVRGEGAGAILLKPLSRAIEDGDYIHAVILGSSVNHGGKANSLTVPNPTAQAEVIQDALKRAGVSSTTISYIEAHGTGTSLGDPVEIQGLKYAFNSKTDEEGQKFLNKSYCGIGSVKTNIGHLETAAGIAGILKAILALSYKKLPPSINFKELNPYIDLDDSPFYIVDKLRDWTPLRDNKNQIIPRRTGVSAFGFGGVNAHVVMEEYNNMEVSAVELLMPQLIILSAQTEEQVREYARRLLGSLDSLKRFEGSETVLLNRIAYTLQVGREEKEFRLAIIAASLAELREQLDGFINQKISPNKVFFQKANNSNLFIFEWDETNDFIDKIIQKRDLAKVAKLWVNGMEIKWRTLYQGKNPKRIPLPTYPFKKTRYWLPEGVKPNTRGESLHPVIDQNVSEVSGLEYMKKLSRNDFYLRDHVVNEHPILPGVVYLEMVTAGANLANPKETVKSLEKIVWLRPVELKGDSESLHLKLSRKERNFVSQIVTKGNEGREERHFQCNVIYNKKNANERELPKSIALRDVEKRCSSTINADEFYAAFKQIGLNLGPSLRAIKKIWRNENEVLVQYALADEQRSNFGKFLLHPSILDAAITSPKGMLSAQSDKLYLPFAIESVDLDAPVAECGYIYTTISTSEKETSILTRKYDIAILDENGQVSVRINKFMPRLYAGGDELKYYIQDWVKSELAVSGEPAVQDCLLVFVNQREEYDAVVREHSFAFSKGCRIIGVLQGDRFAQLETNLYQLETSSSEDYWKLLNETVKCNELGILFNWLMAEDNTVPLTQMLNRNLKPVFHLTKALLKGSSLYSDCRMLVIHGAEYDEIPFDSAIVGYLQTLTKENIKIKAKAFGAASNLGVKECLEYGIKELIGRDYDDVPVLYKENERYRRNIRNLAQNELVQRPMKINPEGTYLITGGLGQLGYLCATYIAENRGNLILAGRSGLDEAKRKKIKALEAKGVTVQYIPCNISVEADVKTLMQEVRAHSNPLCGVIHVAGASNDKLIHDKSFSEMEEVVSGKALGAIWIDRETQNEKLDFFVLFSSTVGVIGNAGQSDYAYANAFLDNFARYRNALVEKGKRKGKSLSIAWPLWENGGIAISEKQKENIRMSLGTSPLKDGEGMESLKYLLTTDLINVMVLKGDFAKIVKVLNPISLKGSPEKVQIQDTDLNGFYRDLMKTICKTIKIDYEVDPQKDLSGYGFDSITYTELANQLNSSFDLDISPAVFFEYPTLSALFTYIKGNYSQALYRAYSSKAVTEAVDPEREEVAEPFIEEYPFADEIPSHNDNSSMYDESEPIAVIGMSCVMPKSKDATEFWENLISAKDLIQEIPEDRWDWKAFYGDPEKEFNKTKAKWGGFIDDVGAFDAKFFHISPKEATLMDPQQRIFLQTVWKTIEDAGYKASDLYGTNTGIYVGVSGWDYNEILKANSEKVESLSIVGIAHSVLPNRISYLMDWRGPSEPIDTACSSSLVAIHKAVEQLQLKKCDLAVAGGVNIILSPAVNISFNKAGMLSPEGRCKTFDKSADGYVRGEGAGAILLKPLSKAIKDNDHIYGIIRGTDVNHGGQVNSFTVPNPNAQAEVICKALQKSNISPNTITYIEAHGTGTSLGDPVEISGLKKAFKISGAKEVVEQPFCGLGAVKTNIGHLEAAAGIAGIIKVLLALENKQIPATIHFKELNPYCNLKDSPFYIVDKTMMWQQLKDEKGNSIPRRAGVSSFGFGGVNSHIVIEEHVDERPIEDTNSKKNYLLVLSAKDKDRLREYAGNLKEWLLKDDGKSRLADIVYTLQNGREEMTSRLALVGTSKEEFINMLADFCEGKESPSIFTGEVKKSNQAVQDPTGAKEDTGLDMKHLKEIDTQELAQLWVRGVNIDWKKLYEVAVVKRVSLPTYPFSKKVYWVKKKENAKSQEQPNNISAETYDSTALKQHSEITYTIQWELEEGTGEKQYEENVLIITNETSQTLTQSIKRSIGNGKTKVVSAADIRTIKGFEEIEHIYFLSGVQKVTECVEDEAFLKKAEEEGILAMFQLIKMLDQKGRMDKSLKVTVVSNNVYSITREESIQPSGGSLYGFFNSIIKEYVRLEGSYLDIDVNELNESVDRISELILNEKCSKELKEIGLRQCRRYVRRIYPVKLKSSEPNVFKAEGVYVILGGRGGIGSELARYLSSNYRAKIILIGRKPTLTEEEQERLQVISKAGGQVRYISADGGNELEMREAIGVVEREFGKINGVIHSAIVLKDKLVRNMEEAELMDVMWPKVNGSIALYKALRGKDLDFVLYLSSVQSFTGMKGQSNYSGACTFKDSYSRYVASKEGWRVRVINWGYWGSVGVVSGKEYQERMKRQGIYSVEVEEGMDSIEKVLRNPVEQVIVINGEESTLENIGIRRNKEIKVMDGMSVQAKIGFGKEERLEQIIGNISGYQKLEQYGRAKLLEVYQDAGLFRKSGEQWNKAEVNRKFGIISKYERLSGELIHILERGGYIKINATRIDVMKEAETGALNNQEKEKELVENYKEIQGYLRLLNECIKGYKKILRGELEATEVIFPESSMDLVGSIYKGNPLSDHYNRKASEWIRNFVEEKLKNAHGKKIRILEVGAGTGGTSEFVLKALQDCAEGVEYDYTDISEGFIRYGRKMYGAKYPFSRYMTLDIEKGIDANKYGSYDLVLGTNVLHATVDIGKTLTNIKQCLKKGGALVLSEMVRKEDYVTMTFGLLDGWWLYQDGEKRLEGSPLLDQEKWRAQLHREGFERVDSHNRGEQLKLPQDLLIAYSNGVIIYKQGKEDKDQIKAKAYLDPAVAKSNVSTNKNEAAVKPKVDIKKYIEDEIMDCLSSVLSIEKDDFDKETPFVEFGIDSILSTEFIKEINEKIGIELRTTEIYSSSNIESLVEKIYSNYKEKLLVIAGSSQEPVYKAQASGNKNEGAIKTTVDIRKYIEDEIVDCLSSVLSIGQDDFDKETPFIEFGIDSILSTEFIKELNVKMGIELRTTEIYSSSNIESLVGKIYRDYKEKLSAKAGASQEAIYENQKDVEASADGRVCELNLQESDTDEQDMLSMLTRLYNGQIGIEEINIDGD